MTSANLPSWLPVGASTIEEGAAQDALHKMQRCAVHVPLLQRTLQTAYLETPTAAAKSDGTSTPPLVFLSAFDASCLDFRLLLPLLAEEGVQAWAVDLVGWGFTEAGVVPAQGEVIGPAQRRAHMLAFWQQKVKRPMVLAGSSIGASTVIDFAWHHPEAIAKLVLMGPAAWNEGLGLFPWFPRWAGLCVTKAMRSNWFRKRGFSDVYYDQSLVSEDTMRINGLHKDMPGWSEAIIAFAHGGGYHLRSRFPKLEVETLVLWGRNDKFANPKFATNYEGKIKHCQVVWLEKCGHCASIEHPAQVAQLLLSFLQSGLPVKP